MNRDALPPVRCLNLLAVMLGMLAVLLLVGCYGPDPPRAAESLSSRGFQSIVVEQVSADWSKCPDNCGDACAHVTSCTTFKATAPWGWPVTGVVVCPKTGTCAVHVIFQAPKLPVESAP